MTPAWLGYFGFKEAPFSKEVADADVWLPAPQAPHGAELCGGASDRASAPPGGGEVARVLCAGAWTMVGRLSGLMRR